MIEAHQKDRDALRPCLFDFRRVKRTSCLFRASGRAARHFADQQQERGERVHGAHRHHLRPLEFEAAEHHGFHRAVFALAHFFPLLGVGVHEKVDVEVGLEGRRAAGDAHGLVVLQLQLELNRGVLAAIGAVHLHQLVAAAFVVVHELALESVGQLGGVVPGGAGFAGPLGRHQHRGVGPGCGRHAGQGQTGGQTEGLQRTAGVEQCFHGGLSPRGFETLAQGMVMEPCRGATTRRQAGFQAGGSVRQQLLRALSEGLCLFLIDEQADEFDAGLHGGSAAFRGVGMLLDFLHQPRGLGAELFFDEGDEQAVGGLLRRVGGKQGDGRN